MFEPDFLWRDNAKGFDGEIERNEQGDVVSVKFNFLKARPMSDFVRIEALLTQPGCGGQRTNQAVQGKRIKAGE